MPPYPPVTSATCPSIRNNPPMSVMARQHSRPGTLRAMV
jgi:hypothetical protein